MSSSFRSPHRLKKTQETAAEAELIAFLDIHREKLHLIWVLRPESAMGRGA